MKKSKRGWGVRLSTLSVIIMGIFLIVGVSEAGEGCKGWDGIPTITVKLPGKGGYHHSKKDEPKKESHKKCKDKKRAYRCRGVGTVTIGMTDIERFHGNVGPGVALGYRACQVAFAYLYPGEIPLWKDQFVVSGAAKACPADAVSFVTGARYGKGSEDAFNGNLAFDKNLGIFNFIFASMSNGKAVKLVSKFEFPQEFVEVRSKMKTHPEAREKFSGMSRCLSVSVLTAPEKEVFEITPLTDFSWKEFKQKYSQ